MINIAAAEENYRRDMKEVRSEMISSIIVLVISVLGAILVFQHGGPPNKILGPAGSKTLALVTSGLYIMAYVLAVGACSLRISNIRWQRKIDLLEAKIARTSAVGPEVQ